MFGISNRVVMADLLRLESRAVEAPLDSHPSVEIVPFALAVSRRNSIVVMHLRPSTAGNAPRRIEYPVTQKLQSRVCAEHERRLLGPPLADKLAIDVNRLDPRSSSRRTRRTNGCTKVAIGTRVENGGSLIATW